MKNFLGLLFQRRGYRVGEGMRGRVHKISIIAGGEVSIVIRCGMDEPRARHLLQGSLVEFFETREGVPPAIPNTVSPPPPDTAPPLPIDPLMTESGDMIERRIEGPSSGDGPLVVLGRVSDTGKKTAAEDTQ